MEELLELMRPDLDQNLDQPLDQTLVKRALSKLIFERQKEENTSDFDEFFFVEAVMFVFWDL